MIRGQKFEVDLGSDDEGDNDKQTPLPGAFVADVLERQPAAPKPPSAPTLKSKTGFPEHRKRKVESRFKQQKPVSKVESDVAGTSEPSEDDQLTLPSSPTGGEPAKPKSWVEEEKRRIDQENKNKLASMTPAELDEERRELMSSLSPDIIQRLLQRSNIESGSNESDLSMEPPPLPENGNVKSKPGKMKTVSFAEHVDDDADDGVATQNVVPAERAHNHDDHDASSEGALPHDTVHFPRPPQPPELDPGSSTFLEDLHEKYFPSLPADPDKLEWMQPGQTKDAYSPSASAFNAGDIRFSFKGQLIAPRDAAEIPVTAGLHHHGNAPDAAGYTISELAHLARSTYAAQRCIAFLTLGRFLYRLGKGEFGDAGEPGADVTGEDDSFGELARGLWHEVEKHKVIEMLIMESEGQGVDKGRHVSARAYATEAVHLWRKGGGRRWKAA